MATLTIADMKERILATNPSHRRPALNAKENPQTNPSAASSASFGSGGQAHGAVESGAMAYLPQTPQRPGAAAAVPSLQTLFGGTTPYRIPKPSELFGIQPGLPRASSHPAVQHIPVPPGLSPIPQLPAGGLLAPASVTRQREHGRRLRAISKKMNRATLQRRMEAANLPPTVNTDLLQGPYPSTTTPSTGMPWMGVLSGLRQWCHSDGNGTGSNAEQDVGVHMEFDTDVVDALVYTLGRWMGLNTEQLRDSPGLRTLVSRNIQWFRSSPDWLKLTGLVLAKKLNQSLDCPPRPLSDTQRMLLDRMLSSTKSEEGQGNETTVVVVEPTAVPEEVPVVPDAPETGATAPVSQTHTPRARTGTSSATKKRHVPIKRKASQADGSARKTKSKETSPAKRVRIATPTKAPKPKTAPRGGSKTSRLTLRSLLSSESDDASGPRVSLDTRAMETDPETDCASPLLLEETQHPSDPADE